MLGVLAAIGELPAPKLIIGRAKPLRLLDSLPQKPDQRLINVIHKKGLRAVGRGCGQSHGRYAGERLDEPCEALGHECQNLGRQQPFGALILR